MILASMLIENANAKAFDEITKENLIHSVGVMLIQITLISILGKINTVIGILLHMRKYGNLGAIITIKIEDKFNFEHIAITGLCIVANLSFAKILTLIIKSQSSIIPENTTTVEWNMIHMYVLISDADVSLEQ